MGAKGAEERGLKRSYLGAHHDDAGDGNTLGGQILSDGLDRVQLFLDLAPEVVLKRAALIRSHC